MAEAKLPKCVDAVKLVDNNQQFTCSIDTKNLSRLNEAVKSCDASVSCNLHFSRDQEGKRILSGRCATRVQMICQRCLGLVSISIDSQFNLGLVFNDEQARQLPRRLDPVEMTAEGKIELWDVIEDEVLLALPEFPAHAEGECQIKQPEPDITDASIERNSPFDVLAQLKQKQ